MPPTERTCSRCTGLISDQNLSGLCRSCSQQAAQTWQPTWPGEWRLDAACKKGMWDVKLWFDRVHLGEPHHCGRKACSGCYCAAKFVCAGCPVKEQCLDHAVESGETAGIWGGLTQDDLKRLRSRRSRARPLEKAG